MFGRKTDSAYAAVYGGGEYPEISGTVFFKQTSVGVLVIADIHGMPVRSQRENPFFAFHIHDGSECSGNKTDPFGNAGTHYNPFSVEHPCHAGDMPPLMSAGGKAYLSFITSRFCIGEIIGRTVVIHDMSDDFTSQPSGNAGKKIACGEIKKHN